MKLNRFRISIFTLTYIFIALISNHLFYLSIFYFICLFHELFHYFMAKALNIYVDEMVLYPFGFVLKINTLIYEKEWKQYLVLIFGPLSFFFSYSIIEILKYYDCLSLYAYSYASKANLSILVVNLLPIYPLDGEKILENLFSHFFDELKTRYFRLIISFITLILAIYMMFSLGNLISFVFLMIILIKELFVVKKEYILYLIKRVNMKFYVKQRIVKKDVIYRFYDNYKFNGKYFEKENEIIKRIIKKEKKLKKECLD